MIPTFIKSEKERQSIEIVERVLTIDRAKKKEQKFERTILEKIITW